MHDAPNLAGSGGTSRRRRVRPPRIERTGQHQRRSAGLAEDDRAAQLPSASDTAGPEAEDSAADVSPDLPALALTGQLPQPVADAAALATAVASLRAGTGPVAVDTERASGIRYWPRAYLLQFAREGAGVVLIDPIACPDLSELAAALRDAEWILHAASQDLPCLNELGLIPTSIFDTELAARLLNYPRVGLATMVATKLGHSMAKSHSAEDWSRRPLPASWLHYAALDVVPLVELRALLAAELDEAGKSQWAQQEFAAALAAASAPSLAQADPWRRTAGIHQVRTRRGLAILAELWAARDELARATDTAPGRVMPDSALIAAAVAQPRTVESLRAVPGFVGRARNRKIWAPALVAAWAIPDSRLPTGERPGTSAPQARLWRRRDPMAADRLDRVRLALGEVAADHNVPLENLLAPAVLRSVVWNPPTSPDEAAIRAALAAAGARPWQVDLTAAVVAQGIAGPTPAPAAGQITDLTG